MPDDAGVPQQCPECQSTERGNRFSYRAREAGYFECPNPWHDAGVPLSPSPTRIDGKFSMKYGTSGGRIINTVSGEEIPEDEPLFLLRARDNNAIALLHSYLNICKKRGCNDLHLAGIQQVLDKFQAFATNHPERMKQPGITKHLQLEPSTPPKPEWVKIGQLVGWLGQEGPVVSRITRITEPQPGNYVLWTKSDDDPKHWEEFPINFRQVEPCDSPKLRYRCGCIIEPGKFHDDEDHMEGFTFEPNAPVAEKDDGIVLGGSGQSASNAIQPLTRCPKCPDTKVSGLYCSMCGYKLDGTPPKPPRKPTEQEEVDALMAFACEELERPSTPPKPSPPRQQARETSESSSRTDATVSSMVEQAGSNSVRTPLEKPSAPLGTCLRDYERAHVGLHSKQGPPGECHSWKEAPVIATKWGAIDAIRFALSQNEEQIVLDRVTAETLVANWSAIMSRTPLEKELLELVKRQKMTFFYIRNLSHDAWRDPPNLEAVCKRIEQYAQMEYDLAEAAIKKATEGRNGPSSLQISGAK